MLRRVGRLGLWLCGAAAAYVVLLVLVGWIASGRVAREVRDRLAESLDAQARVGEASVGLVRGHVAIRDLEVEREHDGHLTLALQAIELDLAPMGAVLWDREPRAVRVRGGRLEVSGLAVLRLPPRHPRPPIRIGALALDDCALALVATDVLPGLARVEVVIERARSGATVLRTALSWVLTLEELVARVELPGGIRLRLEYQDGRFLLSGSALGPEPITIRLALPKVEDGDEVAALASLGTDLVKQIGLAQARRLLAPVTTPDSAP